MDKYEELKSDYLRTKQKYEEKQDEIFFQRERRLRALEEVADRGHYYLKDYVTDQVFLLQASREIDQMKEEVYLNAQEERKQLEEELEELDKAYQRETRKLSDQEVIKKERET